MANSDKNIRITTSKNKTTYPNIVFTGSAAGSSVITLEVLDDNTLSFTSNEGQVFSIDSNLSTGTIWAVSDISGIPMLSSSAGGTVGLATYGGVVGIGQTNPIYKLDLKGNFGLASSNDALYNFIFSNSAVSGSNSLQIRSANSLLLYNSGNTFYTGIKSNASANVTYTLPANDGSTDQFLKTNGSGILSWATPSGGSGGGSTGVGQGGQYEVAYYPGTGASVIGNSNLKNNTATSVVSVNYSTSSLDYTTGAFTVSGGVGIGGSLFVGGIGASISGVSFSNSIITRGTWNATVIAPQYGGTGLNNVSATGLLQYSSGTASVITTSSSLSTIISDGTGTAGKLVFSISPTLSTSVITDSASFNVFNTVATTINAFGNASTISLGAASGKATFNSTDNSTSTTTGGLVVSGGAGFAKSVSIGGRIQLFNAGNYTAFVSSATGNTFYTLPASTPATGTSVLQSDSTGVMSWVPMVASSSGAGSGTVAIPDAQYRLAYYAGTGASVSSTNLITAVGTGVTILGATNASSTTVAALSILGGLGITGNAFIGGTINVASTSNSIISGINLTNGAITSGTWAGSTITAFYGGTGLQGPSAIGDIIVANTATTWSRYATSSTSGQVLTSNGTGSAPTWQAVPSAAASSVAVAPTTVSAQFYIPAVNSASSAGLGLSTVSTLVINPNTGLVSLSGLAVTVGTNASSTTLAAFTVAGGLGITGNAFIGGTTNITSSNASLSTTSGALVVAGGVGIGGSLFTATSTASSISGVIASNGAVTASTVNKLTLTAPASTATLTLANNSSLITSGGNSLTLTTGGTTDVTFPTGTKTLVATDVTSLASLTTASTLNSVGTIATGTWSATAITALYGGTGFNSYAVGDLLVASTGTSLAKLTASANTGYVLTSTGANSVPTWQSVPPSAASTVAVRETVLSQYFYPTFVSSSTGTGLGLSTVLTMFVNPATGVLSATGFSAGIAITIQGASPAISTSSGALVVAGGVGIGGSLFTGTGYSSSISGVVLANNTISASTYNKLTLTAPASTATLTLANNSSLITSGANSLTLTTSGTTDVTFPTGTKTLVATDVTSLASLTTASTLNSVGTIATGTWSATAITALYGGTGFNSYAVGDLLVASTGTSLAKLTASANTGYVLTSTGANSVPTWQSVPPSAASTVAVRETVLSQYFYPTFVSSSTGTGLGLSTVLTMFVNPATGILSATGFSAGIAITILGTSPAINTSSGALVVSGGAGIAGSLFTGTGFSSSISGVVMANGNVSATTYNKLTLTAPTNTATLTLANNSTLATSGAFSLTLTTTAASNVTFPTAGTLTTTGNDLSVFASTTSAQLATLISNITGTAGKLVFSTSPTFSTSVVTDSASFDVFNATATTINAFGAATALNLGQTTGKTTIRSTDVSTSTSTGSLVVSGGAGIAGSLYTGTGFSSSISGVILANGNLSATTYNKLTLTAPTNTATLTLANNSTLATSGAFSLTLTTTAATNVTFPTAGTLITSGATSPDFLTSITTGSATFAVFNTNATTINAFGNASTISIGPASGTATINSLTNSTLASTGGLVVSGGAGVGLSLSIGGRLQIFNSSNYSGFRYAGTANTIYTLPPNSPQSSVGNSVLTSTIDGTMSWIGMSAASGSATPAGSNFQVQYNNSGSFGGATGMTWSDSSNLLTINATSTLSTAGTQAALRLINNNTTDGNANSRWSPALELIGRSGVTPGFGTTYNNRFTIEVVPLGPNDSRAYLRTKYSYDLITGSPSFANDLFRIHSTLGVGIGASNSTSNAISYFRISTSQSGDVSYILPSALPGTGTSVLQSDTSGNLTWVPMAAGSSSGAGSGTVAIPGAQYQVAAYYWSATGASVSGSSTFTNNTATATARITHTTPSTSTSTGALVVDGSVGIGGSLYVGGQINQTYQPTTGAAIDHAIFIQSTPVPTSIGSLIQIGSANKWDGTTAGFFTGSLNGTYIGINAASGNTADFLNFQQNGQPVFKVGAGGTTFQIGQPLDYAATDVLASFKSTVNSYAQFIIQNKSSGAQASADFVLNNDQSNDTTFFGNLGMNSSGFSGAGALAAPNAVYLASTSAPLVLATTTQHPIRILTNGSTTDLMYIHESGTAISVFTNLDLRSQNDLRFFNTGNTFFTALQAANNTANYTLSLPTAPVGAGSSLIIVGSDSNMYFVAPGSGIAFSSATSNAPIIRAKNAINMQFASGFTPLAAGSDTAIIRVPESATDGTTVLTYNLRRFQVRVETPSAGSSRLQLERSSTDTGAFTLAASGSSHIGGFGVTITGAGIYLTSVTSFAGSLVTSGNLLRLNWTLLNATHANFSVNLILEEV